MAERVVITGGAGFIGAALARAHLADGDAVHLLVRTDGPSRPERIPDGAVVVPVPLDDVAALGKCLTLARPTVIYHLASGTGRDPTPPHPVERETLSQDLLNLFALLAATAGLRAPPRTLIRAGSLAEYGDGPVPSREDQREAPLTVYTAAMTAGAHYARMLQPRLSFPVVTARFALTYGPGQSLDYMVPWLIDRCLTGESSHIRRPASRRDMIHVDDVVRGLRCMSRAGLDPDTILNLSTGLAPTVREIANLIVDATGCDPRLVRFDAADEPNFRVDALWGIPDRARDLLGWRAIVPLAEGIRSTTASMRKRTYA